jgi:hypothetical protein
MGESGGAIKRLPAAAHAVVVMPGGGAALHVTVMMVMPIGSGRRGAHGCGGDDAGGNKSKHFHGVFS